MHGCCQKALCGYWQPCMLFMNPYSKILEINSESDEIKMTKLILSRMR